MEHPFLDATISSLHQFADDGREGKGKSKKYAKQKSQTKMEEIHQQKQ